MIKNIAKRSAWFLAYIFLFIWECLKANIDVAFRVIRPSLPIRPGTIAVRTGLKSELALTFLASSITLTPGTTTVDIDRESCTVYVHCLNIKENGTGEGNRIIAAERFEKMLKRIFE